MKVVLGNLGIWDLTDQNEIKKAIDNIQINDDSEIIIDISGCLFFYGTSGFIDKLLEKVHSSEQPKKLIIYISYRFLNDESLYDFLFKKSIVNINCDKNKKSIKDWITRKIKEEYNIDFSVEAANGQ